MACSLLSAKDRPFTHLRVVIRLILINLTTTRCNSVFIWIGCRITQCTNPRVTTTPAWVSGIPTFFEKLERKAEREAPRPEAHHLPQVQVDITELRSKWVQPRVERVTNNTFKLWQVRENLKLSKVALILCNREYEHLNISRCCMSKRRDCLASSRRCASDKTWKGELWKFHHRWKMRSSRPPWTTSTSRRQRIRASSSAVSWPSSSAWSTSTFTLSTWTTSPSPRPSPPGKLTEVRNKQLLCYSASRDLETAVNKDIMTIRWTAFQTFQLNTVSGLRTRTTQTLTWNRCVLSDVRNQLHPNCLGQVRASTPLREMEPTPLDRHRLTHKLQF